MELRSKIALLRGINVGGKRKILMADLKALCVSLGFEWVQTYIQSGNIIFKSNLDNEVLASQLELGIQEIFQLEVPVQIKDSSDLEMALKKNPFYNAPTDIKQLHVTFLKQAPSLDSYENLQSKYPSKDQFKIYQDQVYLLCKGKYHQSKYSNQFFEKHLKTPATTRNWKTVLKLIELSKAP
ncbi:MAG: DUF1697 domain-containing protein [Flavobacteriaceae bacterium]